jgi:hypothetical protein
MRGSDPSQAARDVARLVVTARIGGSSKRCQLGLNSTGSNGSVRKRYCRIFSKVGKSNAMLSTTKNDSWKLAWKSCLGSQSRIMNPEAEREFSRSPGRFKAHPASTIVIMIVERIAEACQPVAAV